MFLFLYAEKDVFAWLNENVSQAVLLALEAKWSSLILSAQDNKGDLDTLR